MTILPLVIAPDPSLDQPSDMVEEVTDEIRRLMDDMLETMYDSNGVGLAAVQIGRPIKVIVADVDWSTDNPTIRKPRKFINPEVIEKSDNENTYNEGCLSFPEQYSDVIRPEMVTIKYLDENGKSQTLEADGMLATCLQHEIDHTNGITFVQHISRLKRDRIIKKLVKMRKAGAFEYHSCGDPDCHHDHSL